MEELEELEPLDDGEISAVSPVPPRTSVPPPIPKHALERSSHPPPLRSSMPAPQRSSLPPAPPPVGAATSSAPPSSGIYRVPENKNDVDRWKDVVRELELKVRLRDDLISELKRSIEMHKKVALTAETRVSAAEASVSAAEARAVAAEARASDAEARATNAEARATNAEARASTAETRAPVVAADDLKRIKGIGPAFERKLHSLGVSSYAAIAGWSEADVGHFADALAILPQRIVRDGWIEKARELAK